MKRTTRLLLLAGIVGASLAGPATSAHANPCTGVEHDSGETRLVTSCGDPCPPLTYGPLDGQFHVILCFDPS